MEFVCEHCGKTFAGKRQGAIYRFCCRDCAAKGRYEGAYDRTLDWKKDGELWQCPYNECVHCRIRVCDRCGWSPDVARMRSEKIQEAKV